MHLANRIREISRTANNENGQMEFVLNAPATKVEIIACISDLNYLLPEDYISFLQNFNGATIFKFEDIDGFEFFDCKKIVAENKFQKQNLEDDWDDRIILICACLGDGDHIGMKILDNNFYEIIDCYHEELPINWKTIDSSLDSFIQTLINNNGQKFWL